MNEGENDADDCSIDHSGVASLYGDGSRGAVSRFVMRSEDARCVFGPIISI
jgi:hypothetical protein